MLIWGWWDNLNNEPVKGIIGGLKSYGHGNKQESISSPVSCLELEVKMHYWAFLMPTSWVILPLPFSLHKIQGRPCEFDMIDGVALTLGIWDLLELQN